MRGDNPIRPPETGSGDVLMVQDIFPTLQGEGPYAGWPAVFVRLGGCNLACTFCDTEFESFKPLGVLNILERIHQFSSTAGKRHSDLVVITGGEPLRQPIAPLCDALLEADYLVQIETNGTLFRPLPYGIDIICSPKVSNGSYHPLRPDLLERVSALKFLISTSDSDYADVPQLGQEGYQIPVYVQPMDEYEDERNKANLSRSIQLAMTHGYRLSLQQHKLLNLP